MFTGSLSIVRKLQASFLVNSQGKKTQERSLHYISHSIMLFIDFKWITAMMW